MKTTKTTDPQRVDAALVIPLPPKLDVRALYDVVASSPGDRTGFVSEELTITVHALARAIIAMIPDDVLHVMETTDSYKVHYAFTRTVYSMNPFPDEATLLATDVATRDEMTDKYPNGHLVQVKVLLQWESNNETFLGVPYGYGQNGHNDFKLLRRSEIIRFLEDVQDGFFTNTILEIREKIEADKEAARIKMEKDAALAAADDKVGDYIADILTNMGYQNIY